jgi:hypothetical protein
MPAENDQSREFVGAGLTARRAQSISRLRAPGMTTIEIESRRRDMDVAAEVQRALEVLQQASIWARPRVRPLEIKGLIQVPDADAERAVDLLRARYMRVAIRPS